MRLALVGLLFAPGLLTAPYLPRAGSGPNTVPAAKPRPKELVKIYAILNSYGPDLSESEAWRIAEAILHESSGYGLDPLLVSALIDVESKFQHTAVSPAGARGFMQILPDVAKALLQELGPFRNIKPGNFKAEHLDDPLLNIKLGVYYLNDLKKSFRSMNLALAAYNIGPTEIRNRLENNIELPNEFAVAVLSTYQKFKAMKQPAL